MRLMSTDSNQLNCYPFITHNFHTSYFVKKLHKLIAALLQISCQGICAEAAYVPEGLDHKAAGKSDLYALPP